MDFRKIAPVLVLVAAVVYIRLGCIDSGMSVCGNVTPHEVVHHTAFQEFLAAWF